MLLGIELAQHGLIELGPVVVVVQAPLLAKLAGAHEIVAGKGAGKGFVAAELAIEGQSEDILMAQHQLLGGVGQATTTHIAGEALAHSPDKVALQGA